MNPAAISFIRPLVQVYNCFSGLLSAVPIGKVESIRVYNCFSRLLGTVDNRVKEGLRTSLLATVCQQHLSFKNALKASYTNDGILGFIHKPLGEEWEALSEDPKIAAWKPLMERIFSDTHKKGEEWEALSKDRKVAAWKPLMEGIFSDIHKKAHLKTETISNTNFDYKNFPTANILWVIFLKTIKDPSIDLNRLTLCTLRPCVVQILSQKNSRDVELATLKYELMQWKDKQLKANPNAQVDQAEQRILAAFQNNSTDLTLSNLNLTLLPEGIARLASLETLDLSNNQLSNFNPSHPLPAGLRSLYLYSNQLSSFDPSHPLPAGLRYLCLSSNKLSSFDPSHPLPASLQNLYLSNNKLSTFNPFHPLPASLQQLDLSNNRLSTFNPSHPLPASLKDLNLNINKLSSFDPSHPLPASLQYLKLSNNKLSSFDPFHALPAGLKILHLCFNNLTGIGSLRHPLPVSLQVSFIYSN